MIYIFTPRLPNQHYSLVLDDLNTGKKLFKNCSGCQASTQYKQGDERLGMKAWDEGLGAAEPVNSVTTQTYSLTLRLRLQIPYFNPVLVNYRA